ncbi:hypothetical protein C7212DRAFT_344984 [Tuber magnatum]|uniref:Uncharacterized protein n=1 Tax=Tuber magnatum TaxID=42249 RepID=A0A317SL24_9PEZI|nr:hypothetical protein C7212DRAFT_344984 [Tuber magnatum]
MRSIQLLYLLLVLSLVHAQLQLGKGVNSMEASAEQDLPDITAGCAVIEWSVLTITAPGSLDNNPEPTSISTTWPTSTNSSTSWRTCKPAMETEFGKPAPQAVWPNLEGILLEAFRSPTPIPTQVEASASSHPVHPRRGEDDEG